MVQLARLQLGAWDAPAPWFNHLFISPSLPGILPSVISMLWDTYVLPMAFFFSSE